MAEDGFLRRHAAAALIICGVWSGYLALLALLGALGFGVGLRVWPLGEDRNWVDLLQRGGVGDVVRGFWAIDHRNPLSPWWYVAAKPIILKWSSGLFLLRHTVGLGLGLSIYALTRLLLGPAARNLAIAMGCLTAIFSANAFFDQIYWNFQMALIASILIVCCFIMHQRGAGRGGWFAGALALWLIAIATYTIQAGAIAANGYLALRRGARDENRLDAIAHWPFVMRRFTTAFLATWPFAVALIVFVMIWQTTSVPADTFIGAPQPLRLLQSLRMGVWHVDNQLMAAVLALSPHKIGFGIVGVIVALAAGAALAKAGPSPRAIGVVDLLVVVACLAAAVGLALAGVSSTVAPLSVAGVGA